jgi:hypothetical protein
MKTSLVIEEGASYNVLVHYHIMKNAGSTISALLEREFSGAFAEVHGPCANSMLSASELVSFIKEHPEIRAISSHHARFPVPREERLHFAYCCFIRHPLDRLHSLYNFFRTSRDSSVVGQLAQSHGVAAFFSEMIDRFPNYVCNVQTNYLANSGFFLHAPGRENLQVAIRIMQNCTIPGLVHRMDESLVIAEYFLNPIFPSIRLHYAPQNVRRDMDRPVAEREREFRDLCGKKIYSHLRTLNQLDAGLVQAIGDEIDRRGKLVPSLDARLADFRSRCSCIAGSSQSNPSPLGVRIRSSGLQSGLQ